jgi:hypothetical protein
MIFGSFTLGVVFTCLSLMFGFKEVKPVKKQILKG